MGKRGLIHLIFFSSEQGEVGGRKRGMRNYGVEEGMVGGGEREN